MSYINREDRYTTALCEDALLWIDDLETDYSIENFCGIDRYYSGEIEHVMNMSRKLGEDEILVYGEISPRASWDIQGWEIPQALRSAQTIIDIVSFDDYLEYFFWEVFGISYEDEFAPEEDVRNAFDKLLQANGGMKKFFTVDKPLKLEGLKEALSEIVAALPHKFPEDAQEIIQVLDRPCYEITANEVWERTFDSSYWGYCITCDLEEVITPDSSTYSYLERVLDTAIEKVDERVSEDGNALYTITLRNGYTVREDKELAYGDHGMISENLGGPEKGMIAWRLISESSDGVVEFNSSARGVEDDDVSCSIIPPAITQAQDVATAVHAAAQQQELNSSRKVKMKM